MKMMIDGIDRLIGSIDLSTFYVKCVCFVRVTHTQTYTQLSVVQWLCVCHNIHSNWSYYRVACIICASSFLGIKKYIEKKNVNSMVVGKYRMPTGPTHWNAGWTAINFCWWLVCGIRYLSCGSKKKKTPDTGTREQTKRGGCSDYRYRYIIATKKHTK